MAVIGGTGRSGNSNFQPRVDNNAPDKAGRNAKKQFFNRNVGARGGRPIVRNGANRAAFKGTPLKERRVGGSPQRQASPGLPRPGARQAPAKNRPMEEPAALKQMRRQNEARQKKLEHEIANLPSPPTGKPKGNGRPSRVMDAKVKANILPSSFKGLSDYIGKTSSVKDLFETFNALTHKAFKGEISSGQLSLLKGRCVGRLVKITDDPKQADLVTDDHLKKMIPNDYSRRRDVASKIKMSRSGTDYSDLRNRLNNLRNG